MYELVSIAIRHSEFITMDGSNTVPNAIRRNDSWQLQFDMTIYNSTARVCSCGESDLCTHPQGFYCTAPSCNTVLRLPDQIIPGLVIGCYAINSMLFSTLECLYEQSCIEMMLDFRWYYTNRNWSTRAMPAIPSLNTSIPSRFPPLTKIEAIVAQAFVEEWITTVDVESHFRLCQPKECTYSWIGRHQLIIIVTNVISLMGGLKVVLMLLVPLAVRLAKRVYYRRLTNRSGYPLVTRLLRKLLSINVYRKNTGHPDALIATRIYLALLALSLTTIALFLELDQQTHSFIVRYPTEETFLSLRTRYPATLSCPCSRMAVSYSTFLTMEPIYHQICSSDFGSRVWSTYVYQFGITQKTLNWLLLSMSLRYQQSMCDMAKKTASQLLLDFLANELISSETLSGEQFHSRINSAIENFVEQTPSRFRLMHSIITEKFRLNQIHTRYMSTWQSVFTTSATDYILDSIPIQHNNGSCMCAAGNSSCTWPLQLAVAGDDTYVIPGIVAGCLPIDGFRQSIPKCFFEQACLDNVLASLGLLELIDAMTTLGSTRFPPQTTTLGILVDELFIESWTRSPNYTNYFAACAPTTCLYSNVGHNNVFYMLSTLLGLYGGLTIGWKSLVWYGLRLTRIIIARCQRSRRVTPVQPQIRF